MSPAPRERLGKLRAGAAALATANVVVGLAVLVAGVAPGSPDLPSASAADAGAPAPRTASAPATVLVLSQHPLLATTTTTPAPAPPVATRNPSSGGATRRVTSTGYCLEGTTASGVPVGTGMVAMNGVALGSRWRIHDGPYAGTTLEVTDRIGHSTEFDIWFDDCADAMAYGRRTITVERVHG